MNESGCGVFAVIGVIIVAVIAIIIGANYGNHYVDGGYAAYVYNEPILGKKEFKGVINGPGSTGYVWRQNQVIISVTPWTMKESFDDILAKDQLKMDTEASMVFRIDRSKVKEFVEEYGAMAETDRKPESIIRDAYKSFIQEPFRTAIRATIAKYNGLDASSHLQEITNEVADVMRNNLDGTPFVLESVTVGRTTPPEAVIAGITRKVEVTQQYERQATELAIAQRAEEIAEAEGRAQAKRAEEEAKGQRLRAQQEADAKLYARKQEAEGTLAMKRAEAEGMKLEAEGKRAINDAIGENYLRATAISNLDKVKFPDIVVGDSAIAPLQGILLKAFDGLTSKTTPETVPAH